MPASARARACGEIWGLRVHSLLGLPRPQAPRASVPKTAAWGEAICTCTSHPAGPHRTPSSHFSRGPRPAAHGSVALRCAFRPRAADPKRQGSRPSRVLSAHQHARALSSPDTRMFWQRAKQGTPAFQQVNTLQEAKPHMRGSGPKTRHPIDKLSPRAPHTRTQTLHVKGPKILRTPCFTAHLEVSGFTLSDKKRNQDS